jgi:hypothetical protein
MSINMVFNDYRTALYLVRPARIPLQSKPIYCTPSSQLHLFRCASKTLSSSSLFCLNPSVRDSADLKNKLMGVMVYF